MPDPIMNPKSLDEAYDIGFADGQCVSLAVADEYTRLRDQCDRLERDNARMADQLQRARMLAEQAGAQEQAMWGPGVEHEGRRGRLALFVILVVAAGLTMTAALARWAR